MFLDKCFATFVQHVFYMREKHRENAFPTKKNQPPNDPPSSIHPPNPPLISQNLANLGFVLESVLFQRMLF